MLSSATKFRLGFSPTPCAARRSCRARQNLNLTENHVALVSPDAAAKIFPAPSTPFTDGSAAHKIAVALDSATDKISDAYRGIANASVEKQKAWVVDKVAGRDIILSPATTYIPSTKPNELDSYGNLVDGEVLVRRGEQITTAQADRAADAGILHSLVLAAGSTVGATISPGPISTLADRAHGLGEKLHSHTRSAAIGKTVGHDVVAHDGSIIVAHERV